MAVRVDGDMIRHFYRQQGSTKPPLDRHLRGFTACTTPTGLGDTLMLSVLPRAAAPIHERVTIHALGASFATLCSFNPFYHPGRLDPFLALSEKLIHGYDLGGGHYTQRLERAWGLPVDVRPKPCLVVPGAQTRRNSVVFHFGPGGDDNVRAQRKAVHPRARDVYPETLAALAGFVKAHPEMLFCEVGHVFSGMEGVTDWTALPLDETIRRMATCEYFIGINSGPMHIAAALDLKIVAIINFPPAQLLFLPALKDVGLFDVEWLYPQSVVLHQDAEGPLVPRFNRDNLERAVAGDIYPYWSTDYLDLIEDEKAPTPASRWRIRSPVRSGSGFSSGSVDL